MAKLLTLEKYSFGVGDRFAHQAKAQLRACVMAAQQGAEVIPVWNKSNREHLTIGSDPAATRAAADAAVKALHWQKALPRGRRPHPPRNRGPLCAPRGLLHHRRGRLDWEARRGEVRRGVCGPAQRAGRAHRDPGHRATVSNHARRGRTHGGASTCWRSRRRGRFTATSPRPKAKAGSSPKSRWTRPTAPKRPRTAHHPRRARRRGDSLADHRTQVHGPLQQGR